MNIPPLSGFLRIPLHLFGKILWNIHVQFLSSLSCHVKFIAMARYSEESGLKVNTARGAGSVSPYRLEAAWESHEGCGTITWQCRGTAAVGAAVCSVKCRGMGRARGSLSNIQRIITWKGSHPKHQANNLKRLFSRRGPFRVRYSTAPTSRVSLPTRKESFRSSTSEPNGCWATLRQK